MVVSGMVDAHEIDPNGRTVIKLLATPKTRVSITIALGPLGEPGTLQGRKLDLHGCFNDQPLAAPAGFNENEVRLNSGFVMQTK